MNNGLTRLHQLHNSINFINPINFINSINLINFMKKIGFLLLLLAAFGCRAQIDTLFWFAPPDLAASHQQVPIRFCFSSYSQSATIVIDQPANPSFDSVLLSLSADTFATYDFSQWVDSVETKPVNTVLNRGFRIRSTTPISCYYESVGSNSEIYALKGTNGLGTQFLVPMQNWLSNLTSHQSASSIEILATEDSTRIEIVAPVPLADTVGGTIPANHTIVIWLNRGQSYAVRASDYSGSGHLSGTRIRSSKPIVVNSTDDSVDSGQGCHDLIGDQIVSIPLLGRRYVALRNNSSFERIYLFATEDSTHATLNGTALRRLDQGDVQEIILTDTANLILSDKPIAVFQITASSCELGGTMLPHYECSGSFEVKHLKTASDIILTVVTGSNSTADFLVNGDSTILTAADFRLSPHDSTVAYCVKNVSLWVPDNSLLTVANTSGRFQLGIIDGTDNSNCTYGFFSDYSRASTLTLTSSATVCEGADYQFLFNSENVSNIVIHGANGLRLDHPPYIIYDIDSSHAGRYWIEGDATSGCQQHLTDSVDLQLRPGYSEHRFDTIREGETYTFEDSVYTSAGDYYHVHGVNENGCDSLHVLHLAVRRIVTDTCSDTLCEGETYRFLGRTLTQTGTYSDTIHISDLVDSAITLQLAVMPIPTLSVTERHNCSETSYTLTAQTDAPYLRWSAQPHDSTLDDFEHDSVVHVAPQLATIYTATASFQPDFRCAATDSLSLTRIATVSAAILTLPDPPCYSQPISAINASTGPYTHALWHINYDDRLHFTSSDAALMLQPKDAADSIHIMLAIGNETCDDTAETYILLPKATLFFPNIILPGSGSNDRFFCASQGVTDFELWIYDRQGDKAFHTTDKDFTWDGTHRGKIATQAAYNYRCRYKDIYHGNRWLTCTGSVVVIPEDK